MKRKRLTFVITAVMILSLACSPVLAAAKESAPSSEGGQPYVAQIVDRLAGGDGLYQNGINGFDLFDYLGYVYMGWRTTGGLWQNQIIGDFVMEELKKAGYQTTDEEVEAPYGSKPASDKSDEDGGDWAWLIKYQETEEKELGVTWDPEYSGLNLRLVAEDGTDIEDAGAEALAESIGGNWWSYNPMTEVYQKNFAKEFGMDYEQDLAPLESAAAKIRAMYEVLMRSDVARDERTGVDDYTFVQRTAIDQLNKEAVLNKRTRLAWESSFTDPSGTDPADADGSEGELLYVGEVYEDDNTNSEGIPSAKIRGSVILTDSTPYEGYQYAYQNGAIGVATITSLEPYLHPKDDAGNILEPWYDSSRYEIGVGIDGRKWMDVPDDVRIVEWQFSRRQYDNTKKLLALAKQKGGKVMAKQVAIGQIYPMTKTAGSPGEGQAVAIAEIKGSVHPEKRVLICAHVQEPGCGDNATGVASLLGMATQFKKLVDEGAIPRPACTLTFMWGDEMNMGEYWMDGHTEEISGLIGALDMDMTGQDPKKTGGVMRIEKTPDPSAQYTYTKDGVPWNEPESYIPSPLYPAYDDSYQDWLGRFVRLPDSHTLWGPGNPEGLFADGWYLNDLYRYVTDTVINLHDKDFRVDVCPFEGGSDHEVFLENRVPALLTWHFTDYNYHTSSDTLYMASPREMENVSITTLATALMMSDLCKKEEAAIELLGAVKNAAMNRMDLEKVNTDHHMVYAVAGHDSYEAALENEKEVLSAWGKWYAEALDSVATLVDDPSDALTGAIHSAKAELEARTEASLEYAELVMARAAQTAEIDDFLAKTDVPAELKESVDAIAELAKEDIAEATKTERVSAIATRAMQEIKSAIEGNASEKALAFANYKADAQKTVINYMKANRKYLQNDLTLGVILAVASINAAKDKAAVDAALKKAKAEINRIVKAKKARVTGVKVTFKKKRAVIRWKKTAGVSGYHVFYKLKTAKKWKTLKTTKASKVISRKLKKGVKYQFLVRAYTKIQGRKIYGPRSSAETATCR